MTRVTPMAFLFAALVVPEARGADSGPVKVPHGAYQLDEQGQPFRVRFDPGTRITLGLGLGVLDEQQSFEADAELLLGLCHRRYFYFGDGDDQISWQIEHQVLFGWVRPWSKGSGGAPVLEITAYRGEYLRHAEASFLMLPGNPPRRLFFPLDIGVEAEAGRVQVAVLPAGPEGIRSPETIRVTPARASLVLDPWRPGRPGNGLEIGLGVRYDLDLRGTPSWSDPVIVHRVAPFTATSVRLRLQDGEGWSTLDARADAIPAWASQGGWGFSFESSVHLERLLLAINDQPLAVFLDASYRRHPPLVPGDAEHEFRAVLGLAVDFQYR